MKTLFFIILNHVKNQNHSWQRFTGWQHHARLCLASCCWSVSSYLHLTASKSKITMRRCCPSSPWRSSSITPWFNVGKIITFWEGVYKNGGRQIYGSSASREDQLCGRKVSAKAEGSYHPWWSDSMAAELITNPQVTTGASLIKLWKMDTTEQCVPALTSRCSSEVHSTFTSLCQRGLSPHDSEHHLSSMIACNWLKVK